MFEDYFPQVRVPGLAWLFGQVMGRIGFRGGHPEFASDVMIVNFSPGANLVAPVDATSEGSQHIAAVLPPGGSIQVIDTAAVDNAAPADGMVLHAIVSSE